MHSMNSFIYNKHTNKFKLYLVHTFLMENEKAFTYLDCIFVNINRYIINIPISGKAQNCPKITR